MNDTVLVSWRDGKAKQAIIGFIAGVTTQGGPDLVPPADRIATFDNDGTLWVEQPLPPQFDFVFGKWALEIKADPALAQQQPYKAILLRDRVLSTASDSDDRRLSWSRTAGSMTKKGSGRGWHPAADRDSRRQVRPWAR